MSDCRVVSRSVKLLPPPSLTSLARFKEEITELHDSVEEHHAKHVDAEEPVVEKASAELSSETKVLPKGGLCPVSDGHTDGVG